MERSGGDQRQIPALVTAQIRPLTPSVATNGDQRQPTSPNCHAGGRGFESRRSRLLKCLQIGTCSCLPGPRVPYELHALLHTGLQLYPGSHATWSPSGCTAGGAPEVTASPRLPSGGRLNSRRGGAALHRPACCDVWMLTALPRVGPTPRSRADGRRGPTGARPAPLARARQSRRIRRRALRQLVARADAAPAQSPRPASSSSAASARAPVGSSTRRSVGSSSAARRRSSRTRTPKHFASASSYSRWRGSQPIATCRTAIS